MKTLLFVLFAFTGVALAEDYQEISVDDLKAKIEAGDVLILDVNGSKYYKKARIPGAIDFRANEEKIAELLGDDKEKLVVAYCGGPSCEAYLAGAEAATAAGFKNVVHLKVGISGWIGAGGAIEKSE